MATLRTIRNRIKGTRNIKQITRAMEAVSAVKMRKSQSVALAARPYATAALGILRNITASTRTDLGSEERSVLGEKREVHPHTNSLQSTQVATNETVSRIGVGVKNVLLVVVTSDKGLAGALNTNVLKKAEQFIKSNNPPAEDGSAPFAKGDRRRGEVTIATVGKKAGEYFARRGRTPIVALTGFGDYAEIAEVEPIFEAVINSFCGEPTPPSIPPLKRGEGRGVRADEVYIIYTNFLSVMKQEVVVRKLLPFSEEGLEEMVKGIVPERGRFSEAQPHLNPPLRKGEEVATPHFQGGVRGRSEYIFEPSPKEIFDSILPALLKIQIYHAILEANASEHSSRMVAMRNATDNASELIKSYTVSMNKARQSAINKELAEITGGSEALA